MFGGGFGQAAVAAAPWAAAIGVALAGGYLWGRRVRRGGSVSSRTHRDIQRARAVVHELDKISTAIRDNLAQHQASLTRFKERIADLGPHDQAAWKSLCNEAHEILKPTLRLATQIACAYDEIRQQTNHLMAFTEIRTDPLTGVRNRRALDEALDALFQLKNRYEQPFSLVIFDLDDFKQVNDEHGHITGDRVLRAVAELLDEHVRETDVMVRFGGEEFVVVMPQTDLDGAAQFCERLRKTVEQNTLAGLQVTVSGGVAMAEESDNAQTLLSRADAALYDAKAAGRNRVHRHCGVDIEPVEPGDAVLHR